MRTNVNISELTTMRLGGPAKYVTNITEISQIAEAYTFAKNNNLPLFIIGSGSNIIGRDEGFPGIILVNELKGIEAQSESSTHAIITAFSGEILDDFIAFGVELGYSGMEALSAIPGTLGAAPVQNVGAYGQDLSQTLQEVTAFDSRTGAIVTISAKDMELSYRRSIFNYGPDKDRYFIISVTVKLNKIQLRPPFYTSLQAYVDQYRVTDFSPANIRRMVSEIRHQKLPDPKVIASAGSFFKNIQLKSSEEISDAKAKGIMLWLGNEIASGWLIEEAGLKGKEFFGFRVSDKAALILINEKATQYADLAKARQAICSIVKEKFGFQLEQEPVEIVPPQP